MLEPLKMIGRRTMDAVCLTGPHSRKYGGKKEEIKSNSAEHHLQGFFYFILFIDHRTSSSVRHIKCRHRIRKEMTSKLHHIRNDNKAETQLRVGILEESRNCAEASEVKSAKNGGEAAAGSAV